MSDWADVSSAAAGALVFIVGALTPRFVEAAERWMDKVGNHPATTPPPATPPETTEGNTNGTNR